MKNRDGVERTIESYLDEQEDSLITQTYLVGKPLTFEERMRQGISESRIDKIRKRNTRRKKRV